MKAPYTIFNETRMVEVEVYVDGWKTEDTTWQRDLWIERGEDWYEMMGPDMKGKKVRVIRREDWLRSKLI